MTAGEQAAAQQSAPFICFDRREVAARNRARLTQQDRRKKVALKNKIFYFQNITQPTANNGKTKCRIL